MSEALEAIAGRSGWIISDGRTGNDVQARGVFDALGLAYAMKRVEPRGVWKLLAPWAPVNPAERFGVSGSTTAPPWPEFAICVGRQCVPYIRKLRRLAGRATYTIILLDTKVGLKTADLFWVPAHDSLRGPNVVTTLTAPHSFSARRLAELRAHTPADVARLPTPRVGVLLGGPNGDYRYTPAAVERLAGALRSLAGLGAGLMITTSRRTPAVVTEAVEQATRDAPRILWTGEGENPYPAFLAHADAFIAPADSVNMTGEPCATGRPVYVFEPDGGSAKFARFHEALRSHGATRPCPARFDRLDSWSYAPLNSSDMIAAEIARRWGKRRQMLGPPAARGGGR